MVLANCPGNLSSAFSSRGGYQVLILSPEGYDYVGGLTFEGYGLLGPGRV
jgi:hypothetical protein